MAKSKIDIYSEFVVERLKIMEYSFEVHDQLKKLFKKDLSDSEIAKAYYEKLDKLYSSDPEPLSRRNTAYYVWGLVKNLVTKQEKKRIFSLLETLDKEAEGYEAMKKEFYKLALKYDVESLILSRYFDQILRT